MSKQHFLTRLNGRLRLSPRKFKKDDEDSEGEQISQFSLSSNTIRTLDMNSQSDMNWNSSCDSLNHFDIDTSKRSNSKYDMINSGRSSNSMRKLDDSFVRNCRIEEEKDDDFDREIDMNIDECPLNRKPLPLFKKKLSLHMLPEDVDIEQIINDPNEYPHPKDEEFPELRKENSICPPKHLLLRKMNSDIYDSSHHALRNSIDESDGNYNKLNDDDYCSMMEPICSIKSKRQKKKMVCREINYEQISNLYTKKAPKSVFTMNNKENLNPFLCEPVDNTESVDLKLYKIIDFDQPYQPTLEVIEVIHRKHPSMNTISCHTLSDLLMSTMDDGKIKKKNIMVIDCRFEYEYERGHIIGAKNMTSPNEIYKEFFETQDKIVNIFCNSKLKQLFSIQFNLLCELKACELILNGLTDSK